MAQPSVPTKVNPPRIVDKTGVPDKIGPLLNIFRLSLSARWGCAGARVGVVDFDTPKSSGLSRDNR